jgi:long-chain acyl-CoA synthetase
MNAPTYACSFQGEDTPARVFRQCCQTWAEQPALRHKKLGLWQTTSWETYFANARAAGLALAAMGLKRGDGVCVLAENRPEWLYVDMGAQCMGMVGNGAYPTSSAAQLQHILQDAGSRVLFVENQEQLDKALAIREHCPQLQRIVVMEREGLRGFADPKVDFFDHFMAAGHALAPNQENTFNASIDATQAEDLAFLVYTSGTTGEPKGAMISNRNVVFQLSLASTYLDLEPGDKSLSFLPLCHIAERMSSVYCPLATGLIVHFPENAGTVFNDLREVAPHMLFAPPRFWEKMYSQIDLFMRDAIAPARWAYRSARAWGAAHIEAQLQAASAATVGTQAASAATPGTQAAGAPSPAAPTRKVPPPGHLHRLLQWLALRNVRIFLGLQNVKSALTGAAPVPPELIRWYLGCGIELREAFGMTETTGFCSATPSGGLRLGWAGTKAAGTEIRIGPDQEILIRGPHVFQGYWKQPEKTQETLDAEDWLHTGDCGEIDANGYLAIRDRIKDILITSGGKNITPSHIESLLKFSPYITDAIVIGDGRKYLSCLVMIDQEHVARFAQEQQVPYTDFASLTRTPEVNALIHNEIERINPQLARVEQIKTFRIIGELLTAEDEELTPTMKLKRKVIARKYAGLIDSMYPQQ